LHTAAEHAPVRPVDAAETGTGRQMPAVPTPSQRWHSPSHAESQHTPSTQWLLWQSVSLAHVWPLATPHTPMTCVPAVTVTQLAGAAQLSGSAPETGVHTPSAPATLHRSHVPHTPASQQTPSTQCSEVHCPPLVHAVPLGNTPVHTPPKHCAPVMHWLDDVQLVGQSMPPPHRYAPHSPRPTLPATTVEQKPQSVPP
jgi:hypothetical protein